MAGTLLTKPSSQNRRFPNLQVKNPKTKQFHTDLRVNILSRQQGSGVNLLTLLLMTSNVSENMPPSQRSREHSCGRPPYYRCEVGLNGEK